MPLLPPISQAEFNAIELHLRGCLDMAESGVAKFKPLAAKSSEPYVAGQLQYFKHLVAAYKKALDMAKHRLSGKVLDATP